jgi:hypothetical protein
VRVKERYNSTSYTELRCSAKEVERITGVKGR